MTHHAQFYDKLVYEFLGKALIYIAVSQIILYINIEERRYVTQRHRCPILLLDSCEVCHIDPLHGLLCRRCGTAQVQPVVAAHLLHRFEGMYLLGNLLAQSHAGLGHGACKSVQIGTLHLYKAVYTVQCKPAIVAYDTAAGIIIGQSCQETERTVGTYLLGICVENTIVMRFAIVGKYLLYMLVQFQAMLMAGLLHHLDTTEGFYGTFEQHIGLQAHNQLIFAVYISGLMRCDCRDGMVIDGSHTSILAFFGKRLFALFPHFERALGRTGKERCVAFVRSNILTYKVAYINFIFPHTGLKLHCLFHSCSKKSFSFNFAYHTP